MAGKSRFDISSQNFDLYFADQIPKLTPEAKDGLPKDIIFKLFRKGGAFNSNSTSKLNFIAKLYILLKCLKKRWYIVVEDEERGMRLQDFNDLPRLMKEREYSIADAEDLKMSGGFVLAGKELCNAFAYLNYLSVSSAYNYLIKGKNGSKNKADQVDQEMCYISRFLINWESQKKNIVSQTGLNIPEILVLILLYPGLEVPSSSIYKTILKRAYQSSQTKIKIAYSTLQQRGYINKIGVIKGAKMQITPLGKDLLRGIINKYAINF